jgi:hypothetical protein
MFYRLIPAIFGMMMLFSPALTAQDDIKPLPKKKNHDILERIDFGGYLGIQFGTITLINISPLASYRITPKFHAGLGLTYQYYQDNTYNPHYSSSAYGGSIFARYFIWRDLFVHLEYAPLYITNFVYYPPYTNPTGKAPWAHDILIGGGYRQWIGDKAFMSLMLLWNLNQTIYSPYSNPIFRIGFGVGF